ncbi:MAG: NAD(P)/FAD-dependent oxidoreductase [Bacteroidota bacterium]
MENNNSEILIIGGGLTGLTLAYYLQQQGIDYQLVEARDRLGGRIFTRQLDNNGHIDMGAAWLWPQNKAVIELLKTLGLKIFEQHMGSTAFYEPMSSSPPMLVNLPPNDVPSYRIVGGTSSLINQLAESLDEERIHLLQAVNKIENRAENLLVSTENTTFQARKVVSTLPPALFFKLIEVNEPMPEELIEVAATTQTWMGESIKIGLSYASPFWLEKNLSGTVFSNAGPIPEMYDHSNYEQNAFALMGFLNGSFHAVSKEKRLALILNQLSKYYGERVKDYLSYEERVWRVEKFTFTDYPTSVLPHQNNGHEVYKKAYLDGKLFFGGTETSAAYSGYMEGAILSANRIFKTINQ